MHYTYDVSQYPSRDFAYFVRTGVLDSLFSLVIAFMEAGVNLDATIITSWTRTLELSAYAVLKKLMLRVWDLQVSPNTLSTVNLASADAAISNKALAEKASQIEVLMKSRGALNYTGDWPRPVLENCTSENVGRLKKANAKKKNPSSGSVTRGSPIPPELQDPGPSPWMQYKSRLPIASSASNVDAIRGAQERQREKRWSSTSRVDRVRLLDPEDQELAIELSRTNLDARNQRLALNRLSRLHMEKQSKILECSKALKQAQKTPPADN